MKFKGLRGNGPDTKRAGLGEERPEQLDNVLRDLTSFLAASQIVFVEISP